MKTTFTIVADTSAMTVTLTIKQAGGKKYERQFATVTDAARFLLNGIAKVMDKEAELS